MRYERVKMRYNYSAYDEVLEFAEGILDVHDILWLIEFTHKPMKKKSRGSKDYPELYDWVKDEDSIPQAFVEARLKHREDCVYLDAKDGRRIMDDLLIESRYLHESKFVPTT